MLVYYKNLNYVYSIQAIVYRQIKVHVDPGQLNLGIDELESIQYMNSFVIEIMEKN